MITRIKFLAKYEQERIAMPLQSQVFRLIFVILEFVEYRIIDAVSPKNNF